MKPLNQAERNRAFLKFLLLFIITVIVVMVAVFFGTRVPFEENAKMQKQINACKNDSFFAEKFSARVSDVLPLLDTLGGPNAQTESINNQITLGLADLDAQKNKVVSGNDNIYAQTIHALYDLQSAKYSLAKAGMQSQDAGKLEQENVSLKQRLSLANDELSRLSQQGIQTTQY